MTQWALFESLDGNGEEHAMPVDEDGEPVGQHEPSRLCRCHWRKDKYRPLRIVHHDPERGGFNA